MIDTWDYFRRVEVAVSSKEHRVFSVQGVEVVKAWSSRVMTLILDIMKMVEDP